MSNDFTEEQTNAIWARIGDEQKRVREAAEARNTYPLATVVPDRPNDATTRVIRAFLAFLDVLNTDGAQVEYQINSMPVAIPFGLSHDFYRSMLSPLANKERTYTRADRESLVSAAKAPLEKMLLTHETEVMQAGQPLYGKHGYVASDSRWKEPTEEDIMARILYARDHPNAKP